MGTPDTVLMYRAFQILGLDVHTKSTLRIFSRANCVKQNLLIQSNDEELGKTMGTKCIA